jgi:hypothetical protein
MVPPSPSGDRGERVIFSVLSKNHAWMQALTKPAPLSTSCKDKLPLRGGFTRASRHAGVSMCICALLDVSI